MKQGLTDITIVLDRSGSMESVANDTIGGFNRFLDDQKKVPGSATLTLHQFDDRFETVIPGKNINEAPHLTDKTFVPRGSTALLDAIGRAIKDTGSRLSNASDGDRAEKVVFVIITDGFENASHEYNKANVFDMIEHQKSKYAWEFVFLGANQDAIKNATGLGINASNAMTYAANAVGTDKVYASASMRMASFRVGAAKSMAFTEEDREEQLKAGAKEWTTTGSKTT